MGQDQPSPSTTTNSMLSATSHTSRSAPPSMTTSHWIRGSALTLAHLTARVWTSPISKLSEKTKYGSLQCLRCQHTAERQRDIDYARQERKLDTVHQRSIPRISWGYILVRQSINRRCPVSCGFPHAVSTLCLNNEECNG